MIHDADRGKAEFVMLMESSRQRRSWRLQQCYIAKRTIVRASLRFCRPACICERAICQKLSSSQLAVTQICRTTHRKSGHENCSRKGSAGRFVNIKLGNEAYGYTYWICQAAFKSSLHFPTSAQTPATLSVCGFFNTRRE